MTQTEVVAGGRLTDWISLGVLASAVPRDAVDEVIEATGKAAKRAGGKLPPHVMVYFAMALALFADDDYEEVAARLAGTLRDWDCWDEAWEVPTSGGITQARRRLGYEPLQELFSQVAAPVAEELTRGAFLGRWRLMAIDGFEWDAPATEANIAAFGFAGASADDLEKAALTVPETGRLLAHPPPPGSTGRWLDWRRCHQARSRWYHQRTRLARDTAIILASQ
jgi:Insertion element 4 transposase N-terminal